MTKDPTVREVLNARAKLFEECGEDIEKLLDQFKEQESMDQNRLVSKQTKNQK